MFERIDKLRDELERAKKRRAEAERRVKQCEVRLKEAENNQILQEVGALKLTPEQVAQFLQMAASGQLPVQEAAANTAPITAETYAKYDADAEDDFIEREDEEDEEV